VEDLGVHTEQIFPFSSDLYLTLTYTQITEPCYELPESDRELMLYKKQRGDHKMTTKNKDWLFVVTTSLCMSHQPTYHYQWK